MKNSITRLFFVVLVILIGVFITLRFLKTYKPKKKLTFAVEQINKIIIKKPAEEIKFIKVRENWKVGDYLAENSIVNNLLSDIANLEIGEIVSEDEKDIKEFWVDDESGISLQLCQDEKIISNFIIGKQAHLFQSSYLRYPSDKRIYICYGIQRHQLEKPLNDWRKKSLLSIDRANVNEIKIARKKQEIIIQQKEGKWFLTKPTPEKEINVSKIEGFLDTLLALRADDFYGEPADFSKPKFTIELSHRITTHRILLIEKNNKKLLKIDDDPTIYVIWDYKYDNLNLTLEKLK